MAFNGPLEHSRGGLSKADREYLLDERKYGSKQAERNTRSRIRRRLINSLLDYSLALETLPERDRRHIFSMGEGKNENLPEGILGALGFIYLGLTEGDGLDFDDALFEAVNRAEAKRGYYAEVELQIQRKPLEAEDIRERMDEGEDLPQAPIIALLEEGDIDVEDLVDYLEKRRDDESEDSE